MTYEELIRRTLDKDEKEAFTLAEILIAVAVIGVIAALAIPSILNSRDRREWMSGLNKTYTTLSNGFKQAESINGKVDKWSVEKFLENFLSSFNGVSSCDDNDCVPEEHYLNGEDVTLPDNAHSYILQDGQVMTVNVQDATCTSVVGNLKGICGTIYVDINGLKGPNTWGKDYFGFYMTTEGIYPFGTQKIDVLKEGYEWTTQGCNNGEVVCAEGKLFSCADAASNKLTCDTCKGDWTVYSRAAYSEDVYAHQDTTYKIGGYTPNAYQINSYTPNSYVPNSYKANSYTPNSYIPSAYKVTGYKPETYTPSSYTASAYKANGYTPSGYTITGYTPSAYTPSGYKPTSYTPNAYTPNAYTPSGWVANRYTPSNYTPSGYRPTGYKPSAYTPSAYTPSASRPTGYRPTGYTPSAYTPSSWAHSYTWTYTYGAYYCPGGYYRVSRSCGEDCDGYYYSGYSEHCYGYYYYCSNLCRKDWVTAYTPSAWTPSGYTVTGWTPTAYTPSAWTPSAYTPIGYVITGYKPSSYTPSGYTATGYKPSSYTPTSWVANRWTVSAYTPSAYTPNRWTVSAYTPNSYTPSAYTPNAYTPSSYTPNRWTVSAYTPNSYIPNSYIIIGYTPSSYTPNSYVSNSYTATYTTDKYSHDYVSYSNYYPAIYETSCPGAPANVCFGYKYTQQWDCWYNPEGNAFSNDCNANGTASQTSCNLEFKDVNALYDCSLDDRGTTCGAWAIVNGNMIYLDDKQVLW